MNHRIVFKFRDCKLQFYGKRLFCYFSVNPCMSANNNNDDDDDNSIDGENDNYKDDKDNTRKRQKYNDGDRKRKIFKNSRPGKIE